MIGVNKMKCSEAVFTVLEGLGHPVRSGEARDLVASRFPLDPFGINSVPATLSMLAQRKKIGRLKMSDGSFGYYALGRHGDLSDAVSVGRPVVHEKKRLPPSFENPSVSDGIFATGTAQRDIHGSVPYKASVALPVADAIASLIGTDAVAPARNFASQALDLFCCEKPWLEDGFFWVRCHGVRNIPISVSATSTKTPRSYLELVRMYRNGFQEFGSPVVVRDRGERSEAQAMNSSYFSTTAIIWFLINHTPKDFQENDGVFQNFLAYASKNYVNDVNVVDAYVEIYERTMKRKTNADESDDVSSVAEQSDTAAAAMDAGGIAHIDVVGAMWTSDGLKVVLHIPHGMAERLLRESA